MHLFWTWKYVHLWLFLRTRWQLSCLWKRIMSTWAMLDGSVERAIHKLIIEKTHCSIAIRHRKIPDSLSTPFTIVVYSYYRASFSKYELSCIMSFFFKIDMIVYARIYCFVIQLGNISLQNIKSMTSDVIAAFTAFWYASYIFSEYLVYVWRGHVYSWYWLFRLMVSSWFFLHSWTEQDHGERMLKCKFVVWVPHTREMVCMFRSLVS